MVTPKGQRVYDIALSMLETLPPRTSGAVGPEVLIVHDRMSHAVHPDHKTGRILEMSYGSPGLLGRRFQRIVIDRSSFMEALRRNDAESRHRARWVNDFLLCRLDLDGQLVLV